MEKPIDKINSPHSQKLSVRLAHSKKIIELSFQEKVIQANPAARSMDFETLTEPLSPILDTLAKCLDCRNLTPSTCLEGKKTFRRFGAHRAKRRNYTVEQLLA